MLRILLKRLIFCLKVVYKALLVLDLLLERDDCLLEILGTLQVCLLNQSHSKCELVTLSKHINQYCYYLLVRVLIGKPLTWTLLTKLIDVKTHFYLRHFDF